MDPRRAADKGVVDRGQHVRSYRFGAAAGLIVGWLLNGALIPSAAIASDEPAAVVEQSALAEQSTLRPASADEAIDTAGKPAPTGFATRHARFEPAAWGELPGWQVDDLSAAWNAFQQSCVAMRRRAAWAGMCARATTIAPGSQSWRAFFEREFSPYEIQEPDTTVDGVITGYYEPILEARRARKAPFVIPVHGVPHDLLSLDMRLWPKTMRGQPIAARLEGRKAIPDPSGKAPYLIDVGDLAPDVQDKRLRLRPEGRRLVPYFTRAEIEDGQMRDAPVIAWVDNAAALYSMQIQGSGKLRLPGGRMIRVGYGEQNGHPFKPPAARRSAGDAGDVGDPSDGVRTRGLGSTGQLRTVAAGDDAEVLRMIELLRPRAQPPVGVVPAAASAPVAPAAPVSPKRPKRNEAKQAVLPTTAEEVETIPRPTDAALAGIRSDPSYVFFREFPDGPGGPIGALGVPLTPRRSVAVDPRTTPLGSPVYLATTEPGRGGQLNRLVMAQDTGGAIRGAVRADFFWGLGNNAYAQASRMKESGRMWVLLPRDERIAARDDVVRTRSLGGAPVEMPDCVVADPELCVED